MSMLQTVEIEPPGEVDAAVIWMHGLGADGHDFEPVVPHLGLPQGHGVRFVFPHARAIPVTINGGMVMPAWYDVLSVEPHRQVAEAQLRASAAAVGELIERETARGIVNERIIVAGFSQGGAVGYELALSWPEPLGGLIALSTYFATAESIKLHAANRGLPVFIAHGLQDMLIEERHGRAAHERLSELGYACEYRSYAVEHGVALDEIQDIGTFINTCLSR